MLATSFYRLSGDILLRPRSAISRIVCLTAQRMESLTSLNCAGGNSSRAICQLERRSTSVSLPGKQVPLIALSNLKNPPRCSGNSAKSLLIISSVGSKTASRIGAIWLDKRGWYISFPSMSSKKETYAKLGDNDSHDVEDFRISSSGDITCVITQNSIK